MTLAEKINSISWGGEGYASYGGECKSSPGAAEKQAMTSTIDDRNARKQQFDAMGGDLADVEGGDVTQTPMYHRLLTQGTEDTARAYDNVRAKRSAMANRSGFGYNQPATQADATSVDAMEAKDVGSLAGDAANTVQGYRMQAANTRAGAASTFNSSAAENQQQWGSLEQKRKEARAKMWTKVAGVGLTAASFIPGAQALAPAGIAMLKG